MIWNYNKYAELAKIMQNDDEVYAYSLIISSDKQERTLLLQALKELSELCMKPKVLQTLSYGSMYFEDAHVRRKHFVASVHGMIRFYKTVLNTTNTWCNAHKQAA